MYSVGNKSTYVKPYEKEPPKKNPKKKFQKGTHIVLVV